MSAWGLAARGCKKGLSLQHSATDTNHLCSPGALGPGRRTSHQLYVTCLFLSLSTFSLGKLHPPPASWAHVRCRLALALDEKTELNGPEMSSSHSPPHPPLHRSFLDPHRLLSASSWESQHCFWLFPPDKASIQCLWNELLNEWVPSWITLLHQADS